MRRWMSSTSAVVMRPSATPRWLVTTTTRSPAARSEPTASATPGRNSKSSHDSTYSPGGAFTLMTPSRSRKTVVSRSDFIGPPRAQAVGLEGELGHARAELGQAVGDLVLAVVAAVEEHVAAAAGTGDLAAQRADLHGLLVHLVDVVAGDPVRH